MKKFSSKIGILLLKGVVVILGLIMLGSIASLFFTVSDGRWGMVLLTVVLGIVLPCLLGNVCFNAIKRLQNNVDSE